MHGQGGHDGHGQVAAEAEVGVADDTPFMTGDKVILLLGLITYGTGQSILFITFPPLVETIGLTITQFGYIMSASFLMLAIASIYWGRVSDRVGRKPLLMFGLFGYALGTTLVALSLEWGVRGSPTPLVLFIALLGARMVYSGLASAINPSATAYIADTTSRKHRARGMALMGMSSGFGTLLGPLIGGALVFISAIAPLYFAAVLAVLACVLIGVKLEEPERHSAPAHAANEKLKWSDKRVFPFLIMLIVFWMGFTMNQIIIAFFLEKHVGIETGVEVAKAAASALLSMAFAALIMQGYVMQRYQIPTRTMFRLGFPTFFIGLAFMYFGTGMWSVWVAFAFLGISMALSNAGITGGASLSVEAHEQGAVGGLLSAAPILGMCIGPLIGPVLFEQVSPTFPILFAMFIFALLSVYGFLVRVPGN
ncbi:MAG: MFS transporter [Gammaproteobacteria bacterium]